MLRTSPAPRWHRALLAFAVGGSLTACHFPGNTAPPTTPAAAPSTAPAQYAPQAVPDGEVRGLTYNMKLVSQGPFVKGGLGAYSLQQVAECPPPLPEDYHKITTSQQKNESGSAWITCVHEDHQYYYYAIVEYPGTNTIGYTLMVHREVYSGCEGARELQYTTDGQAGRSSYCTRPSPTPGPSATPSPSPSPSAPPSVPPSSPPTPGPSPSVDPDPDPGPSNDPPPPPPTPTPTPTSTPTPEPKLTIEHGAISPDGDGKEEDTPIHVEATGNWELEASGGELDAAATIASGSGNGSITFSGKLANGEKLLDGTYTITLTEKSSGKKLRCPVKIESALDLQVKYPAFSPNEEPDGNFDTNTITITSNARWTLKATGLDNGGNAAATADLNATITWDGTSNLINGGGAALPDGKYRLALEVGERDPVATEVIIDRLAPSIEPTSLEFDGYSDDKKSFKIKGRVDIRDNGLAGINPNSISLELAGPLVSNQRIKPADDGSYVTFEGQVALPLASTYRVAQAGQTGEIRVRVSVADKLGNVVTGQLDYSYENPAPGAVKNQDRIANGKAHAGLEIFITLVKAAFSHEAGAPTTPEPAPDPNRDPPAKLDNRLPEWLQYGQSFSSTQGLRKYYGLEPKVDKAIEVHHIVGQFSENLARFGPKGIHNTLNAVPLPKELHDRISIAYQVHDPKLKMSLRDHLKGKSYEEQYKAGVQVLIDFGVVPPSIPRPYKINE